MEDSWELVSVPTEIKHSTACRGMSVDGSDGGTEKQEGNSKIKKSSSVPKLCGFLNKLGAKGIRTWKTRWFVYDERKCRLHYYRTPQDFEPLGNIDLANASFSFDVENPDRLTHFEICTSGRVYHLQAKDKQTMMFWLQELQARRREYSRKRATLAVQQKGDISALGQSTSGLLAEIEEEIVRDTKDGGHITIIEPVPAPESVGEEAATKSPSSGILSFNLSLTNLKTELKNISAKRSSIILNSQQQPINISAPLTDSELSEQLESEEASSMTQSSADDDKQAEAAKSTFQSHIKSNVAKPNSQSQEEIPEEKPKAFSSNFLKAGTLRRKFAASRTSQSSGPGRPGPQCLDCEKLQAALSTVEKDLKSATDEIKIRQDVIESLHEHLRYFELEKANSTNDESGEQRSLEDSIKDKLIYIKQLEEKIKQVQKEKEVAMDVIKSQDKELRECRDQIQMYQEMTAVKDQVVVSLTNQLCALERSAESAVEAQELDDETEGAQESEAGPGFVEKSIDDIQEIGKLKETCQAYVLQNRFLNSEILEFNKLRANDAEILKAQAMRLATLEAEMCKYKSKYFLVLREFQKPHKDGEFWGMDEEVISRLVEDAIDSESREVLTLSRSSIQPFDRWGFRQNLEGQDEEAFLSLAKKMDRRSEQLKANLSTHEMSLEVKWENYIVAHKNRELQKTPELKSLVRAGIPHEHRATVWKQCINHCVQESKRIAGEGYYEHLLESIKGRPSPAVKQIELDLLRTLPNNKHYETLDADGACPSPTLIAHLTKNVTLSETRRGCRHTNLTEKLRNVLLAYSWHNPDVGYCQGLNRLVAIALFYLTEEESFWCLVAIVEHLMPKDYYSKTLVASQADQRVLRDLLAEKLPRLNSHFESLGVDLSLVSFNWFLTVFVDSFPFQTSLRVWDTFLFEGNKVLFRYALAVFKSSEEQLLKVSDHMSVFNFMRQIPEKITDAYNLTQIAFQFLNPFPMQRIKTKRAYHLEIIKRELAELDKLREDYVISKAEEEDDDDSRTVGALGED